VPALVDATAPDLSAFRAQLVELGAPEPVVGAVMALVEQMTKANHQLAFRLQAALRQLYRKKSEKISSEQLALFLAQLPAEVAADAQVGDDPAPADDEIPTAAAGAEEAARKAAVPAAPSA
jgi:transposase